MSTRTNLPGVALTVEPVVHETRLVRVDDVDTLPDGAFDGLPDLLVTIARVIGLQLALGLATARGGSQVYIPVKADDDHWLVATIGRDAADALIKFYGTGTHLDLPLGPTGSRANTWRRMYRMIEDGASSSQITRKLGISRDTVKYHRRKLRTQFHNPQLDLLDLLKIEQD